MAGSVVDIDAQRRAEEALRLSEERYAIAMTGSDEAHWVWNVKTDELFSSPQLHRLTGIEGELPTTRSEWRARVPMHPDDRDSTQRAVDLHLAGLTPRLRVEYRVVDPAGGEVRWISSRGQCFRDADGRPDRVAGSTAGHHRAQARRGGAARERGAVRARRRGLQRRHPGLGHRPTTACSPPSARCASPVSTRTSSCARTTNGWRCSPSIPTTSTTVKRNFRRQPKGGQGVQEADCRVRHGDGSWRWVRFRGRHLADPHGRRRAGRGRSATSTRTSAPSRRCASPRSATSWRSPGRTKACGTGTCATRPSSFLRAPRNCSAWSRANRCARARDGGACSATTPTTRSASTTG